MIGVDTTILVHLEIKESPDHERARNLITRNVFENGEELALTPQVLTEFLHIVTDSRRFQFPLSMDQAVAKSRFWWQAREVRHVYPTAESTLLFLDWLVKHKLGRKRLLDTHLAATLYAAGVRRIMTSNPRDFKTFDCFEIMSP